MSVLFPEGISHLDDLPWTLHTLILQALGYLSFEELPKDERPPKRIWTRTDEMKAWWKMVERRRDEKYGRDGDTSSSGAGESNAAVKDMIVG